MECHVGQFEGKIHKARREGETSKMLHVEEIGPLKQESEESGLF